MTLVIVNDASCLIDMRKGRLLHAMLALPFRFMIPYPVRHSEVLDFTPQEWQMLEDGGVETYDLPPERVREALQLRRQHPGLSSNDCFCLVSTRCFDDAVLLTGDRQLRLVAEASRIEVHGVLWMTDRLEGERACGTDLLISALETWQSDPSVFLPPAEVEKRLDRLRNRS